MAFNRLTGAALVAGSGVIFSFGALIFGAVETATAWQYLLYRAGSVVVVMFGLLTIRHRGNTFEVIRTVPWRVGTAGVFLAAMFTFFILALERTTAATTLFLQATAPFVAAIVGWLVLRERVRTATWAAMAVAITGVAIMVGINLDGGGGANSRAGVAFALGIALLMGCYSVLLRSVPDLDPALPAFIAGVVAAVTAAGFCLVEGGVEALRVPLDDAVLAFLGGGVTLGLGLPLFNLAHRYVRAAEIPLLLMTEVVLAPIWVWIWQDETPTTRTLVGGAIVLSAVAGLAVSAGAKGDDPVPDINRSGLPTAV